MFADMQPKTTLLAFLIESDLGSRRWLAAAIRQGRVQVNGIVAENFRQSVDLERDSVSIDSQPIGHSQTETICLMLNKPAGVITTTSDEKGRTTVLDFVPPKFLTSRLYPIGRLDKNSTGLLILTNNGNMTYQLTHPKFEHEKEYYVAIKGKLNQKEKEKLARGIMLSGTMTYPARILALHKRAPFNYSIAIHEGKKRQVRRMFEELGYRILALKRVRIGSLLLGDLKEGEVRELSIYEVNRLLTSGTRGNHQAVIE